MPASWFSVAILITLLAGVLDRFVQAQRQTEAGALDRFYLHTLRHPLQALREWEWSGVYVVIWAAFHVGIYLILIVGFSLALLVTHSNSVLLPGCFWPSVGIPLLAVLSLVRTLRKTGTPRAVPPSPEGPATEPDHYR